MVAESGDEGGCAGVVPVVVVGGCDYERWDPVHAAADDRSQYLGPLWAASTCL